MECRSRKGAESSGLKREMCIVKKIRLLSLRGCSAGISQFCRNLATHSVIAALKKHPHPAVSFLLRVLSFKAIGFFFILFCFWGRKCLQKFKLSQKSKVWVAQECDILSVRRWQPVTHPSFQVRAHRGENVRSAQARFKSVVAKYHRGHFARL